MAAVVELLPTAHRERTTAIGREVNAVLGQFVRGQLTVMAIVAALYAGGYTLIGVHLAIPIGLVAGLFSFIPYVGSALALGCWWAGPTVAATVSGLAGFAGSLFPSVLKTIRRAALFAEPA